LNRVDAVAAAVVALLTQRREQWNDSELRGLTIEAKLERDGTVRVVLVSPTFVRQTGVVGLKPAVDPSLRGRRESRRVEVLD